MPVLEAEVRQLRMQLQEHEAREQQLRAEVAALKVGMLDGSAIHAEEMAIWTDIQLLS